jgi:hypothetical protein
MMAEFINDTGCVPLGERELRIPDKRMAIIAGAIMLGAIGIVTLGLLPAPVGFALGVLASMLLRTVPLRKIYTTIDWPIIVLLAALIPVAGAMQTTGAADLLAVGTSGRGYRGRRQYSAVVDRLAIVNLHGQALHNQLAHGVGNAPALPRCDVSWIIN